MQLDRHDGAHRNDHDHDDHHYNDQCGRQCRWGGGGYHEKHGSAGGAAPADTPAPSIVTVDPSTVTNTETDIQTTVQTSIATATETVTANPTYQPRNEHPPNDDQRQFQQGH